VDQTTAAYRFVRGVLLLPMSALTRRDWRGQEHIPREGGVVVATNHLSHVDPFTFGHFIDDAGRAPKFLAKSELFEAPVVGSIVRAAGQIPVYRETGDAVDAFRAAVAAVRAGDCVAIYPDGTLTRDPDLWPMIGKTGAARLSLVTGCPLVPVAQWGPQAILAPYHRIPRLFPRPLVHVWAGPPVELDDLRGQEPTRQVLREATDRLVGAIVGMLEQMRGRTAPDGRFDPKEARVPLTGNPAKAAPPEDGRDGSHGRGNPS
jgi:1-acyl-sn-glycerol-3-phosphate acyltransferase